MTKNNVLEKGELRESSSNNHYWDNLPAAAAFRGVASESAGISEVWSAGAAAVCIVAAVGAELFGGTYDWLPKFCLFSLALDWSLSKTAASHCSTVDTNNLQN